MNAPEFWTTGGGWTKALAPFEFITRIVTARRVAKPGFRIGIPVFCAGNANVGGSGKTILSRDILRRLNGRPFALTRGHGGSLMGPVLVDITKHTPAEIGDEAFLLATTAPTIVSRDRATGAELAKKLGATAIVMDDGLQNPDLVKSASFLVIDGGYGFGNGHLLPAGPLREPISAAAARCVAAIVIGPDNVGARPRLPANLPVLTASLVPYCADLKASDHVIAFAGIGRPQKFFDSVKELGLQMTASMSFPDHHVYTETDSIVLLAAARTHGAKLVTTEKDLVKLPAALRAQTAVVTVQLAWEDENAIDDILQRVSGQAD